MTKPKIVNIVSTGKLDTEFNLSKLVLELNVDKIEYEPESYPGLLFKLKNPKSHVTLYANGKYIILGVTTIKDINEAYAVLVKKLKEVGAL